MPNPNSTIQISTAMGYNNFNNFRLDVYKLNRYYFFGLTPRKGIGTAPLGNDGQHYGESLGNGNAWKSSNAISTTRSTRNCKFG